MSAITTQPDRTARAITAKSEVSVGTKSLVKALRLTKFYFNI